MNDKKILTPEQLEAVRSILGNKDEEEQYEPVEVPTNCKWYETDKITMRPFTFEDEKAALNPVNKGKHFLNFILEKCIKGVDVDSLFLVDRNYLAYKLKEISTGPSVRASIECDSCGRSGDLEIDLNVLNITPVDIDLPLEVALPEIKKTIKITPPKVRDEDFMINFDVLCQNVWRFVSEIDGISDGRIISAVLDKLPVQDMHTILKSISMSKFGMQNEINYLCGCGTEKVVEVPLTENFFGDS